jgi:hypothetical protein
VIDEGKLAPPRQNPNTRYKREENSTKVLPPRYAH